MNMEEIVALSVKHTCRIYTCAMHGPRVGAGVEKSKAHRLPRLT